MSTATLPSYTRGDGHFEPEAALGAIPLLPRNLLVGALHGYRATISQLYGDVCKYYPSCSAYALGAVQQHGALKGSALAAARVLRCHPWAAGGIDDVAPHPHFRHHLTSHGFVVPRRKD
ncbi:MULTISPECIES: membrane protein insertion efficiency factor YidD [unclassified Microbacterium]|uniref:membrane protein insertion efficiency factor YidD n=1 Tax=unclassified Microbacterium TaxID=2609290 RepID=UPI003863A544